MAVEFVAENNAVKREKYEKPEIYSLGAEDTQIIEMSEIFPSCCLNCNDDCQFCHMVIL